MASTLARDLRTAPNLITLSRIALVLVGTAIYFSTSPGLGIALAVAAGLTDYLDGAVARATGQVTKLGEILDQFCDLCFESLALTVAVSAGFFPPYVLLLYLFREFWVMCLRRFMAGAGANIPSSVFGKLKTNFVMWGFLPTFLSVGRLLPSLEPALGHVGRLAVGLGLLFSYLSGLRYTLAFFAAYGAKSSSPLPAGAPERVD
jgi:CDP-diacylglycerol--glycerol-3-phosphate 3-phosphatidyltransferase